MPPSSPSKVRWATHITGGARARWEWKSEQAGTNVSEVVRAFLDGIVADPIKRAEAFNTASMFPSVRSEGQVHLNLWVERCLAVEVQELMDEYNRVNERPRPTAISRGKLVTYGAYIP